MPSHTEALEVVSLYFILASQDLEIPTVVA